jgi:hypothetical protein
MGGGNVTGFGGWIAGSGNVGGGIFEADPVLWDDHTPKLFWLLAAISFPLPVCYTYLSKRLGV